MFTNNTHIFYSGFNLVKAGASTKTFGFLLVDKQQRFCVEMKRKGGDPETQNQLAIHKW